MTQIKPEENKEIFSVVMDPAVANVAHVRQPIGAVAVDVVLATFACYRVH